MPIEFTFVGLNAPGVIASARNAASLAEDAAFQNVVLDDQAILDLRLYAPSLRLVINHRVGAGSPVAAARRIRAAAGRNGGRVAVRCIAGGEDHVLPSSESHLHSWQRVDEYLTLMRRLWRNDRPFDHEGPFYSLRGCFVPGAAASGFDAPIRMGGLSGTALKIAARHADIFELEPGDLAYTHLLMERVRAAAAEHGRSSRIRFALPITVASSNAAANSPLDVEPATKAALLLLSYVEAGVSEFMVTAADAADLRQFALNVAPLVSNSAARREVSTGNLQAQHQKARRPTIRRLQ